MLMMVVRVIYLTKGGGFDKVVGELVVVLG